MDTRHVLHFLPSSSRVCSPSPVCLRLPLTRSCATCPSICLSLPCLGHLFTLLPPSSALTLTPRYGFCSYRYRLNRVSAFGIMNANRMDLCSLNLGLCRKLHANVRSSVSTVISVSYIHSCVSFVHAFMQHSLNLCVYSKHVVALNSVLQGRLYDKNC